MIKTKEVEFESYYLSIDYESDGEIVAVCIGDINIIPLINEVVLERIIETFNKAFDNE